jgi:TrpR-related protein YerC/YecD
MATQSSRYVDELIVAVTALRSRSECRRFLRDLLTRKEFGELAARWRAARMLTARIPYSAIVRETGLSSTTIARVHRWLKTGVGGYAMMIHRLPRQSLFPDCPHRRPAAHRTK